MTDSVSSGGWRRGQRTALGVVFLWFAIGGVAHFVATDAFVSIVPPYVPMPRAAVLVSGALEFLGAVGLLLPRARRAAGIGLCLLTIAVTLANVHMLMHAGDYPDVPYWALVARLPLQLALLAAIAWGSGMFRRR